MPSPFPGMDPYLESRDWFPCLHDSLVILSMEALQTRLPEPYYAQASQRVWLEYRAATSSPMWKWRDRSGGRAGVIIKAAWPSRR